MVRARSSLALRIEISGKDADGGVEIHQAALVGAVERGRALIDDGPCFEWQYWFNGLYALLRLGRICALDSAVGLDASGSVD